MKLASCSEDNFSRLNIPGRSAFYKKKDKNILNG